MIIITLLWDVPITSTKLVVCNVTWIDSQKHYMCLEKTEIEESIMDTIITKAVISNHIYWHSKDLSALQKPEKTIALKIL